MSFIQNISGQIRGKSLRQLVANFRNEYISNGINESELKDNPIDQFEVWLNEAVKNKLREPNAMFLATATPDGKPSGRVVLLKGFDERGFIFYTNYGSRKAIELDKNNAASLTFLWLEIYKQVRVEGTVQRISDKESDQYFNSRPRESQIGAWASDQSQPIANRDVLEREMEALEKQFEGKPIPRPENWGGFCVKPQQIEFWLGRANRLHDRILYQRSDDNIWTKQRLSP
jgi:pyridoxamine 5'-phosphate oxidase